MIYWGLRELLTYIFNPIPSLLILEHSVDHEPVDLLHIHGGNWELPDPHGDVEDCLIVGFTRGSLLL